LITAAHALRLPRGLRSLPAPYTPAFTPGYTRLRTRSAWVGFPFFTHAHHAAGLDLPLATLHLPNPLRFTILLLRRVALPRRTRTHRAVYLYPARAAALPVGWFLTAALHAALDYHILRFLTHTQLRLFAAYRITFTGFFLPLRHTTRFAAARGSPYTCVHCRAHLVAVVAWLPFTTFWFCPVAAPLPCPSTVCPLPVRAFAVLVTCRNAPGLPRFCLPLLHGAHGWRSTYTFVPPFHCAVCAVVRQRFGLFPAFAFTHARGCLPLVRYTYACATRFFAPRLGSLLLPYTTFPLPILPVRITFRLDWFTTHVVPTLPLRHLLPRLPVLRF